MSISRPDATRHTFENFSTRMIRIIKQTSKREGGKRSGDERELPVEAEMRKKS